MAVFTATHREAPITALDGPGSKGLGLRQSYTVTAIRDDRTSDLSGGRTLDAVPPSTR